MITAGEGTFAFLCTSFLRGGTVAPGSLRGSCSAASSSSSARFRASAASRSLYRSSRCFTLDCPTLSSRAGTLPPPSLSAALRACFACLSRVSSLDFLKASSALCALALFSMRPVLSPWRSQNSASLSSFLRRARSCALSRMLVRVLSRYTGCPASIISFASFGSSTPARSASRVSCSYLASLRSTKSLYSSSSSPGDSFRSFVRGSRCVSIYFRCRLGCRCPIGLRVRACTSSSVSSSFTRLAGPRIGVRLRKPATSNSLRVPRSTSERSGRALPGRCKSAADVCIA